MQNDNTKYHDKIKIQLNCNTPQQVLDYYSSVFESTLDNIIRYFSIYNFLKKSKANRNIILDYYFLLLINVRKLFENPMQKDYKGSNICKAADYQMTFNQWITYYIEIFKTLDKSDGFLTDNLDNIEKTTGYLKINLIEFQKIYQEASINTVGSIPIAPFKERVFNAASKFVAHNFSKDRVEEWEYNNRIFVTYEELKTIAEIMSNIQDKQKTLMYYWNNVVKIETYSYNEDFQTKIEKYVEEFIESLSTLSTN